MMEEDNQHEKGTLKGQSIKLPSALLVGLGPG